MARHSVRRSAPDNEARRDARRLHRARLREAAEPPAPGQPPWPLAQADAADARAVQAVCRAASEAELRRLVHVACLAEVVFGSQALAWRWMCEPRMRLRGATPLACALRAREYRNIERWLMQIEEGGLA
ncbi:MbcA/ParS/Xre antitoxin family protein [Bordetella hinzii]|uniref:MbcA/ParS/Xre antitoxin family protein n=1 Tax=Bordetella hinzii TaxID=103855 RepID=UPI000BA42052|nr:MbcA/ParS/Xre antitoxin family protein [Bordetella hinzii]